MTTACAGSTERAGERPGIATFLPTARCPACGHFVEIHPMEPGGEEVWRLEMHDLSGRTLRLGPKSNPAADCLMPTECDRCKGAAVSWNPAGDDVEANCAECGYIWRTGHLNSG